MLLYTFGGRGASVNGALNSFAFEEAFMKSITIRNLCLLNAPPSSRGLIFPRAAAKKEPRYKKNRYTV